MPVHTKIGLLKRADKAIGEKQWSSAVELYTQILLEMDAVEESSGGADGGAAEEVPATGSNKECSKSLVLFSRSGAYLKMGHFKKCIEDAESALGLESSYVDGYRILGTANLKIKLFGHAEVAVKRGLKLEPGNVALLKLLDEIQADENVHAPVFVRDGSDQRLRAFQQRTGLEMDANTFPDIVRAIMVGDLRGVRELWRRSEHLKLRMTRLKIPLIHFPIIGRQRITPKVAVEEYCNVVDFLFEEGCRLDHRDRVGYTAIIHGCGPEGEHGIIQHMLKKGADPNVQSSFGTTALHDAIQSQHRDIVDTLLQHGADPNIPDNNGTTPYHRGQQFQELIAVLDKQTCSNTMEKQCNNCSSKCAVSRCSKCRYVCYCGRECQVEHWPSHKRQCKHLQKSHVRLKTIQPEDPSEMLSLISKLSDSSIGNQNNPPTQPGKTNTDPAEAMDKFNKAWLHGENILKLQISSAMASDGHQDLDQIVAYNRSRDLMLFLSCTELDGDRMVAMLHEEGFKEHHDDVNCSKGYFLGFSDVAGEMVLITDPRLPDQSW